MKKLFFLLLATLLASPTSARLTITKQTCNYQEGMAVVNDEAKVGWQMTSDVNNDRQTAYQLVVRERITGRKVYDSKRVKSDNSQHIPLPRLPYISQGYEWKVRVWDAQGKASEWSRGQSIRYALPSAHLAEAQWIGAITKKDARIPEGRWSNEVFKKDSFRVKWEGVDTLSAQSIVLRQRFIVAGYIPIGGSRKRVDAQLAICGLGHYVVYLNGVRIGNDEFAPLWSEYSRTTYYNIYDVTEQIRGGLNEIVVILGNGFYNVQRGDRYSKLQASFGPPKLLARLDVRATKGERTVFTTNDSWQVLPSPVTFNSIFGGESYDARRMPGMFPYDRDDYADYPTAVNVEAPEGTLLAQEAPAVRIMERYDISSWKNISPQMNTDSTGVPVTSSSPRAEVDRGSGILVFDMGQNLSGFPEITVKGKAGQTIKIVPGETLTPEGFCDQSQTGRPHYYEYTLGGRYNGETWHPWFSYYGFRYLQVEGAVMEGMDNPDGLPVIKKLQSCFVYSSAREGSSFECSNDLFTKTHRLIERAERSNMQAVLTDCPHREKLGWLEQDHLCGPSLLYNYDMGAYIPKIIRDITDTQKSNGMVPTTAPQYVSFGNLFDDSPEWGSTLIILPFMYYEHYGDSTLITDNYEAMRRYVDYLTSRSDDGIVSHGLGDWYDYGPWKAGYSRNTPVPLVATAHYIYDLQLLTKAARMVNKPADERRYSQLCADVVESFNRHFFHPDSCYYGTNSQTSNALPLYIFSLSSSLGEEGWSGFQSGVFSSLIADIHAHGNRLTTGDVGNRYLFQALAQNGQNELLYEMLNHYDVPGYGYQIRQGATTLTEQWDPKHGASKNHFMMGQIDEWLFKSLAGIGQQAGTVGMKHLEIRPQLVGDLQWVKAKTQTLYGEVCIYATKNSISVDIPVGSTARVFSDGEWHDVGSGHWDFAIKTTW